LHGHLSCAQGFAEQVYFYDLLADNRGQSLAALINSSADRRVMLRFQHTDLPCFTVGRTPAYQGALNTGQRWALENRPF
jgi:hypothetical protein